MIIRFQNKKFLLLKNEPDIQEVWDTIRRIRCVWEIDMLNQETVTFSDNTASIRYSNGQGTFCTRSRRTRKNR